MKYPILAYGHPALRKKCEPITPDFPNLHGFIEDMWETMKNANGCGLAAPQIGVPQRVFIVDSRTTFTCLDEKDRAKYFSATDAGILETFINAQITERSEDLWEDNEGCLSIPGVSQTIRRSRTITIEYRNTHYEKQTRTFSGTTARMIQHEYDHIEGILFLDHLSPFSRKLLASRLKKISRGQIRTAYPMKFV